MAPKAFPEPNQATPGLTRVALQKAFFDTTEAVKTIANLPREDVLRIIAVSAPPAAVKDCFSVVDGMPMQDLALFCVCMCNAFHSGYSTAIADMSADNPRNLHLEYVNGKQRQPGAAPAVQPG